MADIRRVTDTFAVAPQLRPQDLPALSGRYALVINNRPDGEAPDQPSNSEMQAAALAAGLDYVFVPVAGAPGPAVVAAMREAISVSRSTLAFCRSGTRSIVVWALAQALDGRPIDELERLALEAGYDIGAPLRGLLARTNA